MLDANGDSVALLRYREASGSRSLGIPSFLAFEGATTNLGVSEEEMQTRLAEAVERTRDECGREYATRLATEAQARATVVAGALERFSRERAAYFERVEAEVVRLALSIARKILEREARVDPSLLGALVRIALEKMQSGPEVRIRVAPEEVARWEEMGRERDAAPKWLVAADVTLSQGDCVVETQLGQANFGFMAQLESIEDAFSHVLEQRKCA